MHVGIQMKTDRLPWAKKEQSSKEIDLEERLFSYYWTSEEQKFTVSGLSRAQQVFAHI